MHHPTKEMSDAATHTLHALRSASRKQLEALPDAGRGSDLASRWELVGPVGLGTGRTRHLGSLLTP